MVPNQISVKSIFRKTFLSLKWKKVLSKNYLTLSILTPILKAEKLILSKPNQIQNPLAVAAEINEEATNEAGKRLFSYFNLFIFPNLQGSKNFEGFFMST